MSIFEDVRHLIDDVLHQLVVVSDRLQLLHQPLLHVVLHPVDPDPSLPVLPEYRELIYFSIFPSN